MNGFVITQSIQSHLNQKITHRSVTLITSPHIIMNFGRPRPTSDDTRYMCIARMYIPFDTMVYYKHKDSLTRRSTEAGS